MRVVAAFGLALLVAAVVFAVMGVWLVAALSLAGALVSVSLLRVILRRQVRPVPRDYTVRETTHY